tara:strand:+ start:1430 stop:1630 length:201 start_codon:yes stop_codon:yes gene_type:complete
MNYEQTAELLRNLESIESYSRSYQREIARDNTDWDDLKSYEDSVMEAKEAVFVMVKALADKAAQYK